LTNAKCVILNVTDSHITENFASCGIKKAMKKRALVKNENLWHGDSYSENYLIKTDFNWL
jgi:hypothetical protein